MGVAWAKRVPVMSPLVRGRKVTENWQTGVGGERGAGWAGEDELARESDVEGEGLGGEVVDGELACAAESAGGGGAVAGLAGEDLEAGVFAWCRRR